MLQPIAIDTNSFPELREEQCVYVDKTAYFHRLITRLDARHFFLARPRGFGKSLMLSTLQAIFEGKNELFDGLDILRMDWRWEMYPVLTFNMSSAASSISFEEFCRNFPLTVQRSINDAGWTYDEDKSPAVNFGMAIEGLSKVNNGKGVVILIDEYDDPVVQLLAKADEAEKARECLADFYHQMKDHVEKIHFLMITGVSNFIKKSLFTALSNLVDLSFEDESATMLGYTDEEMDRFWGEHIRACAQKTGGGYGEYRAELKRWFNGYRFGKFNKETVYNPMSIGMNLSLEKPVFSSCWSSTDKASVLMNFLKGQDLLGADMDNVQDVQEADFDGEDICVLRTIPMLFQMGYLTIKDYDFSRQSYTLGVPDVEARQELATLITSVIANKDSTWGSQLSDKMLEESWDAFFTGLKSLYAAMPYVQTEGNIQDHSFERVLLTLLWSKAIECRTEDRQANGQADIIAEHSNGIYIFALRVNEPVEAVLEQVKRRGYDTFYCAKGLPIWLIGLSFDSQTRQLLDAKAEKAI